MGGGGLYYGSERTGRCYSPQTSIKQSSNVQNEKETSKENF